MSRLLSWSWVLTSILFFGCANLNQSFETKGPRKEIRDENFVNLKDESSPKRRVLVLPFLDSSEIQGLEIQEEARKDLANELNKTGSVIFVDPTELKVDVSKHLRNGEYDMAEIARLAQQLGIHSVLEAKLLDITVKRMADPVGVFRQVKSRFDAQARVRIYTSRTGKEVFNTVKTVTLEEANMRIGQKTESDRYLTNNPELVRKLIHEVFLDFVPQIMASVDRMNWEGRVAMVNGDRIFLNVGKVTGIKVGDILKVSDEGDEIYDPQSGNFIGKTPGRMKGTLEVVSYFGQDGSIAVIHSGSGFRENDRVELY